MQVVAVSEGGIGLTDCQDYSQSVDVHYQARGEFHCGLPGVLSWLCESILCGKCIVNGLWVLARVGCCV